MRNPMNVKNVGRPLGRGHILLSIKEFVLVRNPMNIRNVGKLLGHCHTFMFTVEFMLE